LLNLAAPVRVAVIDVAGPLADIDCGRAERPPCAAAWILVCKAGRPLGSIEVPLREPVIAAADRHAHNPLRPQWPAGLSLRCRSVAVRYRNSFDNE
jgi:hypothetical protein